MAWSREEGAIDEKKDHIRVYKVDRWWMVRMYDILCIEDGWDMLMTANLDEAYQIQIITHSPKHRNGAHGQRNELTKWISGTICIA